MTTDADRIAQYWGREHLAEAILAALTARGVSLDALTVDVLAPVDQFHGGGKPVTGRLARLAAIRPGTRVLDVGGGFGGPARTLAVEFGCHVTTDRPDRVLRARREDADHADGPRRPGEPTRSATRSPCPSPTAPSTWCGRRTPA